MSVTSDSLEECILNQSRKNKLVTPFVKDQLSKVDFYGIDKKRYEGYKRYLFLDLDLTCTTVPRENESPIINAQLMRILTLLAEKRLLLPIPCTGRPLPAVTFMIRDQGLPDTVAIATNGSTVSYRAIDGAITFTKIQRGQQETLLRRVLAILRQKHGLCYEVCWQNSQNTDLPLNASGIHSVQGLQAIIDGDPEIQALVAPYGGVTLTDSLGPVIHLQLTMYNKGTAINSFCRQMSIPMQQRIYAGNGLNDVLVRPFVSHIISVANGQPAMKAVADYVSSSPGAYGTLDGILRYLLASELVDKKTLRDLIELEDMRAHDRSSEMISVLSAALYQ